MDKSEAQKILGVEPSANERDIKKAFRQKTWIYHPDHGGSESAFNMLLIAKDIALGNDEPKLELDRATAEFLQAFSAAVPGNDTRHVNVITVTRDAIQVKIDSTSGRIKNLETEISTIEDMIARIKCKRADDPLRNMLKNKWTCLKSRFILIELCSFA